METKQVPEKQALMVRLPTSAALVRVTGPFTCFPGGHHALMAGLTLVLDTCRLHADHLRLVCHRDASRPTLNAEGATRAQDRLHLLRVERRGGSHPACEPCS